MHYSTEDVSAHSHNLRVHVKWFFFFFWEKCKKMYSLRCKCNLLQHFLFFLPYMGVGWTFSMWCYLCSQHTPSYSKVQCNQHTSHLLVIIRKKNSLVKKNLRLLKSWMWCGAFERPHKLQLPIATVLLDNMFCFPNKIMTLIHFFSISELNSIPSTISNKTMSILRYLGFDSTATSFTHSTHPICMIR